MFEKLAEIPDWLGGAVLAAVFGAAGWLLRAAVQRRKERNQERESRIAKLSDLASLLNESREVFLAQNDQARRLLRLLERNHSKSIDSSLGFDEAFFRLHDQFNDEERELQSLIRSGTIHSLRRVNQSMRKWLSDNRSLRAELVVGHPPSGAELEEQLGKLELHLNQWVDKFEAVIPHDPKRSLVYLADEKEHGTGFPRGIETKLDAVLKQL